MFALLDCNNFFVSCERVFSPRLKKTATIVLSSNDGCVVARSNEAKALGIKMGEPFFKIRQRGMDRQLTTLSSNFELYRTFSQRVMSLLSQSFAEVEVYSVDEAFILFESKMSQEKIFEELLAAKKMIEKYLGIPVSIGVAKTKTLAKLANHEAKRKSKYNGICILNDPESESRIFKESAIDEVWGIGRKLTQLLNRQWIFRVDEFLEKDIDWVKKQLGIWGAQTYLELKGIPIIEKRLQDNKSMLVSRTFSQSLTDKSEILSALTYFSEQLGRQLRKNKQLATESLVITFYSSGSWEEKQSYPFVVTLQMATSDTRTFIKKAKSALEKLKLPCSGIRRAGILLPKLISENEVTPDLFQRKEEANTKLMETIDQIEGQFGKGSLKFGSQLEKKQWRPNSERKSPKYTSSWNELLVAKA